MNEADTCRKLVVPKLQEAGWDDRSHAINELRTFTDGRIVFVCGSARRGKQKRADYVLRYNPEASHGGAGRNRTLGLKKLEAIEVPALLHEIFNGKAVAA